MPETTLATNRRKLWHTLSSQLDILVIGGGITGAGALREANRLGYSTLLLEQKDFAWGTTSRSSKLVHGGLRYLKQGNILLTYHALTEREWLLKALPGLVEELPFVFPIFKNGPSGYFALKLGLSLYDLLARRWTHHFHNKVTLLQQFKGITNKQLKGGFEYPDAVTDDARLCLRVIQEAQQHGANAFNYAEVTQLKHQNGIWHITVQDHVLDETFTLTAKTIINAAGVWINQTHHRQAHCQAYPKLRPLRGSHLIIWHERLPINKAITLNHPQDNRITFIWPWEGMTIVGTTDIDHESNLNLEPSITQSEVDYLLELVNYYFPETHLTSDDVISTFSGVRPVINTGKANPSDESRDLVIIDDAGLLTITGGKLTTFRAMAEAVVNKVVPYLEKPLRDDPFFTEPRKPAAVKGQIDQAIYNKLVARYTAMITHEMIEQATLIELEPLGKTRTTLAEIKWILANESVVHLDDLLLRRTRLGLLVKDGAQDLLPLIKSYCMDLLSWTEQKWQQEQERYIELWKTHYYLPTH